MSKVTTKKSLPEKIEEARNLIVGAMKDGRVAHAKEHYKIIAMQIGREVKRLNSLDDPKSSVYKKLQYELKMLLLDDYRPNVDESQYIKENIEIDSKTVVQTDNHFEGQDDTFEGGSVQDEEPEEGQNDTQSILPPRENQKQAECHKKEYIDYNDLLNLEVYQGVRSDEPTPPIDDQEVEDDEYTLIESPITPKTVVQTDNHFEDPPVQDTIYKEYREEDILEKMKALLKEFEE
jgi:hypothetical protein